MNTENQKSTTEAPYSQGGVSHRLSDSDHWFDANLRCLLGGEVTLIKKGKKGKD